MPSEASNHYTLKTHRVLLSEVLEPVVRAFAIAASLLGKDREGVELVIRGRLLGGKMNWKIGRSVRFIGPAKRIAIGQNVIIYGNTVLNANGPQGRIHIGSDTHIDHFCVFYGQGGLTIGKDTAIAAGVLIYSQSNANTLGRHIPVARQPVHYAPVNIGDACWIGTGVRVLPGITLGRAAYVGAGAVVINNVADQDVVVGIPAKSINK